MKAACREVSSTREVDRCGWDGQLPRTLGGEERKGGREVATRGRGRPGWGQVCFLWVWEAIEPIYGGPGGPAETASHRHEKRKEGKGERKAKGKVLC